MTNEQWSAVERYVGELLVPSDAVLDLALQSAADAGLPPMHVAAVEGKLLALLAQAIGARRILEIGTLVGYSTIWLARALPPDGRLITLELDPTHAELARTNLNRAGLAERVELRIGPALETLAQLVAEQQAPFDLVFIDADKQNAAAYFNWALKLSRRGSLIITDNVVRGGAVIDPTTTNASAQGIRQLNQVLAAEPRVSTTVLQTVGTKGYDGMAFTLVIADAPAE